MKRTTAFGLWRFAKEYLSAAVLVGSDPTHEISAPRYYLLGHSTELALKAFLLTNGVSLNELRQQIGHDLEAALEKANAFGLDKIVSISPEEDYSVRLLSRTYKPKEHEYIVIGYRQLPQPELIVSFIERLLNATRKLCSDATISAEEDSPDRKNR